MDVRNSVNLPEKSPMKFAVQGVLKFSLPYSPYNTKTSQNPFFDMV